MTEDNLTASQNKEKTAVDTLNTFGDTIYKKIAPVTNILCYASMFFVIVMVAIVVLDVFLRNIDANIPGLNELQTFLMVVVTFFSLAYVTMRKRHIGIDLLLNKFSPGMRSLIVLINDVLTIAIMVLMFWTSIKFGISKASVQSPLLGIPISYAAYIISFSVAINLIVVLAEALKNLANALENLKSRWLLLFSLIVPFIIYASPVWLNWLNMPKIQVGAFSLVFMLVLVFAGLPIAYSVATAGLLSVSTMLSWESAYNLLGSFLYTRTADYFLTVMPFFVLMSSLAVVSGISTDLYKSFKILLGKLPGSLAMATVIGGAVFGAVCGDSLASASAIGKVALPEMKREKYADSLAGGSVAVGGTLGSMIPPSTVFIIYALIVEESVGKLFMAGVGPGILITALLCVVIYFLVKLNPELATRGKGSTVIEKVKGLRSSWGMIVLILLVLGGIYSGFLTPVEAGAFGALGAFVFSLLRKSLNKENIKDALLDAAEICGTIMIILVGVGMIGSGLGISRIPMKLVEYVGGLDVSRWVIFGVIVLLYLFLGCILNIISSMILTLPIIMPTITLLGFDSVWFGVVVVMLVMIGQLTPPVGLVGYVVKGLAPEMSIGDIFKGLTPLWITIIIGLIIICFFPQIALYLPEAVL